MEKDEGYKKIDIDGTKSGEVCSVGSENKCKECQVPGCPLRVGDIPILAK